MFAQGQQQPVLLQEFPQPLLAHGFVRAQAHQALQAGHSSVFSQGMQLGNLHGQVMDGLAAYGFAPPGLPAPPAAAAAAAYAATSAALSAPQMPLLQPAPGPAPQPRVLFFAGVTPVVGADMLASLFANFGRVVDLNLFKPWAGSKTSKGCGLVMFADHAEAAAALDALHAKFHWPGARGPMVVEWMDLQKQHKKARAQPLAQPALLMQQPRMVMVPAMPTRAGAAGASAPASLLPGQLGLLPWGAN